VIIFSQLQKKFKISFIEMLLHRVVSNRSDKLISKVNEQTKPPIRIGDSE